MRGVKSKEHSEGNSKDNIQSGKQGRWKVAIEIRMKMKHGNGNKIKENLITGVRRRM